MHLAHAPTILLPLLSLTHLTTATSKPKNAILLSDVQSLTLRGNNAQTTHRRAAAIPQLRCISSPAICRLHELDIMRCTNQGSGYDSEDIQWSCAASLPPELKLGSTDVACEGYSGPNDPYILKGSCGAEYRLILTEEGEKRFPDLAKGGGGWGGSGEEGLDWSAIIFGVIFALVCMWIVYSACLAPNQNGGRRPPVVQRRPRNNWDGGGGGGFDPGFGPGGGGGGGSWDDPPPPYPGPKSSSSQSQGWRPGFWSGLAGGTAAGYMAGNMAGNRQRNDYGWGAGPSSAPSFNRSNSRSTSSARYESTGFGSTSRR
ncbi:uncharacterized protein F4822DRAFT_424387 [Hypoxylon trugodes]|uniref:uncharacterized protein n=1 Tax=Hypoxylon trugodes TaxID=326681 RepID=UPI002192221E|nr:uncharacterized protein F4822DRAFT_424387 [Hypoxylon trugodes]KAI1393923.1 hypothetical protein F4822DRAFT_424387 [Hypoxylon trugodes]